MICDSTNELRESMRKSAEMAEKTIEMLKENFLSIDENLRKKLDAENARINSAMWEMNVILYKMQDYGERVVSEETFEF